MYNMPNDPHILLSFVNMKLRDRYGNLEDLCEDLDVEISLLESRLREIGYHYDTAENQFKGL